jgi:hypothetical protein
MWSVSALEEWNIGAADWRDVQRYRLMHLQQAASPHIVMLSETKLGNFGLE